MATSTRPHGARLGLLLQTAVLLVQLLLPTVSAKETTYIWGTDVNGVTRSLAADRYPSLYTADFGDCLGGESLFNITKFDAAYYADNSTILFHIDGTSNIRNESLMLHISVDAYGESRFEQFFDPCAINVLSLCPLNASVPIEAWARIPLTPSQVAAIPQIALEIPDFEGSTTIQMFANSTRTRIGCFRAVMVNGNSFSQPEAVAPFLALFTAVAMVASFVTAAYGVSVPHMRTHHAHSFSVLVLFETFQSIFLSGAISVRWPSVLPAWWSNFAWSAGIIYSKSLVDAVNPFAGVSGNASQVGGAGSTVINNGGGLIQQIYGRSLAEESLDLATSAMTKRAPYNESNPYDYTWAGLPVTPGMPLPGTWQGFAGTLSVLSIPAPDAFLVGLVWWVVAVGLLVLALVIFKTSLEILASLKWIKEDRLSYFRSHWVGFTGLAVLRTLFISTFMLTTLSMYQLTVYGPPGPIAIAGVVLIMFLLGMGGTLAYACNFRLKAGRFASEPDRIMFPTTTVWGCVPWPSAVRSSRLKEREFAAKPPFSLPWFRVHFVDNDPRRASVHDDAAFVKRFGWLTARYRRSRWWFFALWFWYQVVRACFIGAGSRSPAAQVYGLFVFEILAFLVFIAVRPFEGTRNNVLAVYLLGIAKIVTPGLSIAFLPTFAIDRIVATVLGIIIIIAQGLVVIAAMILVALGCVSSCMSLTRNREEFKPEALADTRVKYFEHLEKAAPDDAPPREDRRTRRERRAAEKRAIQQSEEALRSKEPYFEVTSVRRAPKIEDEDDDFLADMEEHGGMAGNSSVIFAGGGAAAGGGGGGGVGGRVSRTNSMSSRMSVGSLPRAARAHRTSWSSKDFSQWDAIMDRPDSALAQRLGSNGGTTTPANPPTSATTRDAHAQWYGGAPAAEPASYADEAAAAAGAPGRSDSMRTTTPTQPPPAPTSPSPSPPHHPAPAVPPPPPPPPHHPAVHALRLQTSSGSFRAASPVGSLHGGGGRPNTPLSPVRPMTPTLEVRLKHSQERFRLASAGGPPAPGGVEGEKVAETIKEE